MKKILGSSFLALILFVSMMTAAFAGSGTYNSTYDLTGGLNSRSFSTGDYHIMKVSTYPTGGGSEDLDLSLFLYKESFWGNVNVDSGSVSSVYNDSESLYGDEAGDYYVRFRNYGGTRMTGDVTFNYSW